MIVVDASALALALLDDGPLGEVARGRLSADPHWVAPAHLLVEVVSAIRGKVIGGKITTKRGDDAIAAVPRLTIDLVDLSGLVPRMWQLRDNLSPYDAAYVAMAEVLGRTLVTGNAKLGRATGPRCTVAVIGETTI